eukprot:1731617-Prymnesium_polylepis.1
MPPARSRRESTYSRRSRLRLLPRPHNCVVVTFDAFLAAAARHQRPVPAARRTLDHCASNLQLETAFSRRSL